MKKVLVSLLTIALILSSMLVFIPASAEYELDDDEHVIYSFTFEEEGATTLYKKAGTTPGYVTTDDYVGEEPGASLALPVGTATMSGRGGVLPYIWPTSISGIMAAQGELADGDYYELEVDIRWDGKPCPSAKKGTYVYPFMLTNGSDENYFTEVSGIIHNLASREWEHYTYRLTAVNGDMAYSVPQPGSDSGGIAFCCENTLPAGGILYLDNLKLSKHGSWKDCDTSGIGYVDYAVAPTEYEPTDENGKTADGKQATVLYENDFEGKNPEHIFNYYKEDIAAEFKTAFVTGIKKNETVVDRYYIPTSSVNKENWFADDGEEGGGTYYPVIWFWNPTMQDALKKQAKLQKGDYYVFQMDFFGDSDGYAYCELVSNGNEYEPTYCWKSNNASGTAGDMSPFEPDFYTCYYVFKIDGLDLTEGNTALAMFTDGYVHSYKAMYCDNFKVTLVRSKLLGDANSDQAVDMKDVLAMRKNLAGMDIVINALNADMNEDEAVDMKDVLALRKSLANIKTDDPSPEESVEPDASIDAFIG